MSLLGAVRRYASTGAFAVADQSLIAGSNFLLSALLARWLAPAEYGAFSVIYTAFQLLMTMHMALTTEPLFVLGPSQYRHDLRAYTAAVSRLQWLPSVLISVIMLLVGIVARLRGSELLSAASVALAIVAPLILSQQFMRRAFYVDLKPSRSVWGGVVYLVSMAGVLLVLANLNQLSVSGGFVAMGVGSLAATAVYTQWLRYRGDGSQIEARDVVTRHWEYGRWSVPTTLLTWVPGNVYYVLLPLWHGLEATAGLQAAMNLVLPVQHAISAVAVLLVPAFGRLLARRGIDGLRRGVRYGLTLLLGIAALYGLGVVAFGPAVASMVYGPDKYPMSGGILALAALLAIGGAATSVLAGALRALNSPRRVFAAYGVSFVFSLTGGLVLMYAYGISGALVSLVVSSVFTAVSLAVMLKSAVSARPEHGAVT